MVSPVVLRGRRHHDVCLRFIVIIIAREDVLLFLPRHISFSLARLRRGELLPRDTSGNEWKMERRQTAGCPGRMINFPERTRAGPRFPGKLDAAYFIRTLTRRVANLISSEFHYDFVYQALPLMRRQRPSGTFDNVNLSCNCRRKRML